MVLSQKGRPYYDPAYLDTCINRLVQCMGPTPMATRRPNSVPYKMATKRHHRRDEEIFAINPAWMMSRAARACCDTWRTRNGWSRL